MKGKLKSKITILAIACIIVIVSGIITAIIVSNMGTSTKSKLPTVADTIASGCVEHLRTSLKDPGSLQVYGKYAYYDSNGTIDYIVIDAGAKNGFGGMTRNYFVYTSLGSYIGTDEDYTTEDILNNTNKYTILKTSEEYNK